MSLYWEMCIANLFAFFQNSGTKNPQDINQINVFMAFVPCVGDLNFPVGK